MGAAILKQFENVVGAKVGDNYNGELLHQWMQKKGDVIPDKPREGHYIRAMTQEARTMSALSAPCMHDEAAAFEHIEAMLWPKGPVCPRCGEVGNAYELKGVRTKPSKKNPDGKVRHGLKKCKGCGKQFTVRMGTIFESSHVDLHLWLQAIYLMASSKKGISSHQLAETLGITVKSAWFLSHRIREAMRNDGTVNFGADGGVVEVDEAFIGNDQTVKPKGQKKGRGYAHKHKVLTLMDRNTGQAKSMVVDDLKA